MGDEVLVEGFTRNAGVGVVVWQGAGPEGIDALVEHPQGMGQVADHLDLDAVVLVDLGWDEVDVDDALVGTGIPEPGVVLDHVVAEGDHEVGLASMATAGAVVLWPLSPIV